MAKKKETKSPKHPILIVGAGISGISAAVEASEAGYEVILVEKNPYIGGRVVSMNKYFPKLCPPICGMEINFKRMKRNPRITIHTLTEVQQIQGEAGDYQVTLTTKPRFVNERCTACDECVKVCPVERPNDFNYGMDKTKAIYLPHLMSWPLRYVIDMKSCLGESCSECVKACPYDAIDLSMKEETFTVQAGAVIVATGWKPYDASKIDNLGFMRYRNVITNVMMERLAAEDGPTGGKILRPSDNKEVKRIAFVQCAGSRDEKHLGYCSAVCCSASLKHARYVREQYPDSEAFIFFIDTRTPGRLESFYTQSKDDEKIHIIKGKVADITQEPTSGDLTVVAEDALSGKKTYTKVDMVVLATGLVPTLNELRFSSKLILDEYGFIAPGADNNGVFVAGCSKRPMDVARSVADATGVALKAIQTVVRS